MAGYSDKQKFPGNQSFHLRLDSPGGKGEVLAANKLVPSH